jgi:hypothetical protein
MFRQPLPPCQLTMLSMSDINICVNLCKDYAHTVYLCDREFERREREMSLVIVADECLPACFANSMPPPVIRELTFQYRRANHFRPMACSPSERCSR